MYKLSSFIVALVLFTSCGKKEAATEDFSTGVGGTCYTYLPWKENDLRPNTKLLLSVILKA